MQFLEELEQSEIRINNAILFGSYARGNYNENSDIDLAIISEDFSGTRLFDNSMMAKARLKSSSLIETLPFRPEEFNTDNPFVREIMKHGIEIHSVTS
jgi:predicted nucleotidyltransferase